VGYATIVAGDGALQMGAGPVRTGVTAILPRGKASHDPVFAGWFPLNGNGEMTGTAWVDESGFLEGPICLTNTHSVGLVRDAVVGWQARTGTLFQPWSNPVVAETYDGYLNDINGFHVKEAHVRQALDTAASGPLAEGNVGGGTGMVCHDFKGGTGTASRVGRAAGQDFAVGALVQANYGSRADLRIDGVPVGREIGLDRVPAPDWRGEKGAGSIIVVLATDLPLLPLQCRRLAQRAGLGLARVGGVGHNGSGDIFIAFSTGNILPLGGAAVLTGLRMLPNEEIDPLFEAAIEAVEESILNALAMAETMTGMHGRTVHALPYDLLAEAMARYRRRD